MISNHALAGEIGEADGSLRSLYLVQTTRWLDQFFPRFQLFESTSLNLPPLKSFKCHHHCYTGCNLKIAKS